MLVLTRKVGESFVIGDNITVTVVRIAGGGVRIGIDAPQGYSVMRRELREAVDHMPRQSIPPARNGPT